MKTVVYQSYRTHDVAPWIETCLTSVRGWAEGRGFDCRFYDDRFLECLPDWVADKAGGRLPVMTDLARLITAKSLLAEGYERTIWLDADVLIFDAERFEIDIRDEYALGHEVWVQPSKNGGLETRRNVHNAVLIFCAQNSFLNFYCHAATEILQRIEGGVPPQIIGPKFLTALHHMVGFPLIHTVGMASPLVLADAANGGGQALDLLRTNTPEALSAINLCASLVGRTVDGVDLTPDLFESATAAFLKQGIPS